MRDEGRGQSPEKHHQGSHRFPDLGHLALPGLSRLDYGFLSFFSQFTSTLIFMRLFERKRIINIINEKVISLPTHRQYS